MMGYCHLVRKWKWGNGMDNHPSVSSIKALSLTMIALFALTLSLCLVGCWKSASEKRARQLVEDALYQMEGSREAFEDLHELNDKISQLGERWTKLEDTIAEGLSLVGLVNVDIESVQTSLEKADLYLQEAISLKGTGKYGEYAKLAGAAVRGQLEALQTNRLLASTLADLLFIVEKAETKDQLQYYTDELTRLSQKLREEYARAAEMASEADRYFEENHL